MIDIKEIATSISKTYKTAFDEGYKQGYEKGFYDGKMEGLDRAEEIISKGLTPKKGGE